MTWMLAMMAVGMPSAARAQVAPSKDHVEAAVQRLREVRFFGTTVPYLTTLSLNGAQEKRWVVEGLLTLVPDDGYPFRARQWALAFLLGAGEHREPAVTMPDVETLLSKTRHPALRIVMMDFASDAPDGAEVLRRVVVGDLSSPRSDQLPGHVTMEAGPRERRIAIGMLSQMPDGRRYLEAALRDVQGDSATSSAIRRALRGGS